MNDREEALRYIERWKKFIFVSLFWIFVLIGLGVYFWGNLDMLVLIMLANTPVLAFIMLVNIKFKRVLDRLVYGEPEKSMLVEGLKDDLHEAYIMLRDPEFRRMLWKMIKDWKWRQF